MDATRQARAEALDLIRQASRILQDEKTILASSEDCDYFRALYRTSRIDLRSSPSPSNAPAITKDRSASIEKKPDSNLDLPSSERILREADVLQAEANVLCVSKDEKQGIPPKGGRDSRNEVSRDLPKSEILPASLASVESPPPPALPNPPLALRPMSKEEGFAEIKKILNRAAPDLAIMPEIPCDAQARLIAERWKTKNQSAPISLLAFHESDPQRQFLLNLAAALEVNFGQTRLIAAEGIEKEKQWEAFLSVPEIKLVIICDYALWQMPNLLQYYREVPSLSQRFLLNAPLMLLPDLTLYLKDPLLKRSLWRALCQKIAAH